MTRASVNRPGSFDRPFGLEIEVIHSDSDSVRRAFVRAGLACEVEDYGHAVRTHWKIVPDASVYRGFEVVSPILRGAAGRREARRAFKILRECGATVDATCGLHVHHDASDLTGQHLASLVESWRDSQGLIDGLVAPSRRYGGTGAQWCRVLTSADVADAQALASRCPGTLSRREASYVFGDARSEARYRTLNFRVYSLFGTVEVRQHQGTLNATKALSWVMFAQAFIARCQDDSRTAYASLPEMLSDLESRGLEPTTAAYLSDRADILSGQRAAA